jgi:hypothetical protein
MHWKLVITNVVWLSSFMPIMWITTKIFHFLLQRRICIPKTIQFTIVVSCTFIFLKIPLSVMYMPFSNFKTRQIRIKDMHIKFPILLLNKDNLQ